MRHVLVAGAVAAAALLMAGAVPRPAEALPIAKLQVSTDSGVTLAKRGGGFGRGGGFASRGRSGFAAGVRRGRSGFAAGIKRGRSGFARGIKRGRDGFARPHVRHRHRHHRRGRGLRYYGYAPYYYGYSYYDDECGWLRRKALRTDSAYWWRRYDRCLDAYY